MSMFAPITPSPAVSGLGIVTNGLIGNWDAGNTASYPGSGTTVTDLTGTNNGTLLNGVGFESNYNGAFTFDGSNDAIQMNNVAAYSIGTLCTHECAFYWNGNNLGATAAGKWGGSPWAEYTIGVWGWNGTERSGTGRTIVTTFYLGSSWPVTYLTYEMPEPGIYYVQAVHDVAGYKMWVNGVLRDSKTYATTPTGTFNTNAIYGIGKVAGSAAYFTGKVYFARLYNRMLSDAEIAQNFRATAGRFLTLQNNNEPVVAATGLVGHWDAANTASYPGSGTTWTDLSPSANNVTLLNGPTYSSGNGGAIVFDGTNDGARAASNTGLNNSDLNRTVEAVFHFNNNNQSSIICNNRVDGGVFEQISLVITGPTTDDWAYGNTGKTLSIAVLPSTGGGSNFRRATYTLPSAGIYHAVGTSSSSGLSLYVNGQLIQAVTTSQTGNLGNTAKKIAIGATINASNNPAGGYFPSSIYLVRMYSRALSAAEVLSNYEATKGRFVVNNLGPSIPTDGLVMYVDAGNAASYPGSGTTWTDLVGNTNGTFTNSPTFTSQQGGAIQFNGSSSYVAFPHSTAYNLGSLTILAFVKAVTSGNNIYRPILSKHVSNGLRDYQLYTYNNTGTTSVPNAIHFSSDVAAFTTSIPTGTPAAGTWQQYGCYVNGTSLDYGMIVNGVRYSQGTMGAALPQRTAPIWIGRADYSSNSNKDIAMVLVYNRLLSDAEIARVYEATKGRFVANNPTQIIPNTEPSIPTSGLVLHYDAGNTASYPGSGTSITDRSGSNFTGSFINGPGFNSSNGGAITFDGSNDYINVGNQTNLRFLNRSPYTLEAWVLLDAVPATFKYPGIFWRENNVGNGRDGYALGVFRNGTNPFFGTERFTSGQAFGAYGSEISTSSIVNKWYHCCAVYDGDNLKFYLNGEIQATTASTTNLTNSSTSLEMGRLYAQNVLNGRIAQARIYNVALSDAQVAANYDATRGRFIETYDIEYLIVAGGGSGAGGAGGGGGGGGVVAGKVSVIPGVSTPVTIGAGGAGVTGNVAATGNSGSTSSFMKIRALGGGGGGVHGDNAPQNGGCGGGGNLTCLTPAPRAGGTGFQGGNGGHGYRSQVCGTWPNAWIGCGGGGGGGGGNGINGGNTSGVSGIGGPGFVSTITGSSQSYAGGGGAAAINGVVNSCAGGAGGGGTGNRCSNGTSGTANTGGGGGAGGACSSPFYKNSGSGGSGVVILRMPTARYSGTTTGSPTVTTSGSDTILTFNSSGTYTT